MSDGKKKTTVSNNPITPSIAAFQWKSEYQQEYRTPTESYLQKKPTETVVVTDHAVSAQPSLVDKATNTVVNKTENVKVKPIKENIPPPKENEASTAESKTKPPYDTTGSKDKPKLPRPIILGLKKRPVAITFTEPSNKFGMISEYRRSYLPNKVGPRVFHSPPTYNVHVTPEDAEQGTKKYFLAKDLKHLENDLVKVEHNIATLEDASNLLLKGEKGSDFVMDPHERNLLRTFMKNKNQVEQPRFVTENEREYLAWPEGLDETKLGRIDLKKRWEDKLIDLRRKTDAKKKASGRNPEYPSPTVYSSAIDLEPRTMNLAKQVYCRALQRAGKNIVL